jgi:DNA topoisomerase-1
MEGSAEEARAAVEAGHFSVDSVETKPVTRNPQPPFTTSTLQQEAARKLGFSASHTMRIAQNLYEDGAITYMRTDGVQMDPSAISAARGAIANRYDAGYLPDKPRVYQTKAKNAQEAHEAIRPTDFGKDKVGSGDHAKLYDLIYKRALASQMASARMERTTVDMLDGTGTDRAARHRPGGEIPGFLALYEEGIDDKDDENGALAARSRKGRCAGEKGGRKDHSIYPAPAALFRGQSGQTAGGIGDRSPFDLRLDRFRC